jgi:hypothetical protein
MIIRFILLRETPMTVWDRKKLSFGFISKRFAGTDGVSLETQKWVDVLKSKGCAVYYMAGKLDTNPEISHLAPKAFFQHPDILEVQNALFVEKNRTKGVRCHCLQWLSY